MRWRKTPVQNELHKVFSVYQRNAFYNANQLNTQYQIISNQLFSIKTGVPVQHFNCVWYLLTTFNSAQKFSRTITQRGFLNPCNQMLQINESLKAPMQFFSKSFTYLLIDILPLFELIRNNSSTGTCISWYSGQFMVSVLQSTCISSKTEMSLLLIK